jgi:hypothetical protein
MTHVGYREGMGTLHAWESFGDNTPPDIQAVAKGLGGGLVFLSSSPYSRLELRMWLDTLLSVGFSCQRRSLMVFGIKVDFGSTGIPIRSVTSY